MYSPKIHESLIPQLFALRKKQGRPMTHIVNEIIKDYVDQQHKQLNNQSQLKENYNEQR
jgi:hypothetical protein